VNKQEETRIERVCVALDAAFSGSETLSVAASLAQELDAELAGFFLEDVNVLRAAALSFTCELGLASGRSRPLEVEAVERALRAQGDALKSALARAAEQLQLRWSFVTLRGAGLAPVLDLATEMSVVVFAPRPFSPVARTRIEHRSSARTEREQRCIAVVCDDTAQALEAVHLAALIARSRSAPLTVLVEDRSATEVQALVTNELRGEIGTARYMPVSGISGEDTAAAARNAGAALLVVPFRLVCTLDLADLLHRLACPLVLLK
jgi:hypothetical protein